jgi:hypothetical protein
MGRRSASPALGKPKVSLWNLRDGSSNANTCRSGYNRLYEQQIQIYFRRLCLLFSGQTVEHKHSVNVFCHEPRETSDSHMDATPGTLLHSASGRPKPPIYQTTRHHVLEDSNPHSLDVVYCRHKCVTADAFAMILHIMLVQSNENHVLAFKTYLLLCFIKIKDNMFRPFPSEHLQVNIRQNITEKLNALIILSKELANLRSFYIVSILWYNVCTLCRTVSIIC